MPKCNKLRECIPPLIRKFSAPPNRKIMGLSRSLMISCIQTMKWMKLKTEKDLSYIDPLTVEFFQNNGTSSISVILLTNEKKDRQRVANLWICLTEFEHKTILFKFMCCNKYQITLNHLTPKKALVSVHTISNLTHNCFWKKLRPFGLELLYPYLGRDLPRYWSFESHHNNHKSFTFLKDLACHLTKIVSTTNWQKYSLKTRSLFDIFLHFF